jgi:hypothetical protein
MLQTSNAAEEESSFLQTTSKKASKQATVSLLL